MEKYTIKDVLSAQGVDLVKQTVKPVLLSLVLMLLHITFRISLYVFRTKKRIQRL